LPETPTSKFEVSGAFLNAMVGLLERQANIVPEHLYTKADLLDARKKAREEALKEMEERQREKEKEVQSTKEQAAETSEKFSKHISKEESEEAKVKGETRNEQNKLAKDATRRETRKEIRDELMKQWQPLREAEHEDESLRWNDNLVPILGSVVVVTIGAGIGLFRRAFQAQPELTWHYVGGAGKGAACGLLVVVLFKGMLETFDGRRGFYI
jgi:hypothetical protein